MDIIAQQSAQIVQLEKDRDYWRDQALTDFLTGLSNRQAAIATIERLLADGDQFLLFMLDLNKFKAVNDEAGHEAGDRTLNAIAQSLRKTSDMVYRLGGDEFVVIVKCQAVEGAAIAHRLKAAVLSAELCDFLPQRMRGHRCGASVGWADFSEFKECETGLALVDERMYADKSAVGR